MGRAADVLQRYLDALRAHDWPRLADCLAEDVERSGPYLDVVRGRDAYVAFLAGLVPTLPGWRLEVGRIRALEDASALVELTETIELGGVATRFPEAIVFDFDAAGRICRVDVYLKQPGGAPGRPRSGVGAAG
jgi:hypothetical protein